MKYLAQVCSNKFELRISQSSAQEKFFLSFEHQSRTFVLARLPPPRTIPKLKSVTCRLSCFFPIVFFYVSRFFRLKTCFLIPNEPSKQVLGRLTTFQTVYSTTLEKTTLSVQEISCPVLHTF